MPKQCLSGRKLWRCGETDGFYKKSDGKLLYKSGGNTGIFVSRIYDSGTEGTEWNHIRLDIDFNAVLEVYVWLFDEMDQQECGRKQKKVSEYFEYIKKRAQYHSNYRNMLLYGHGCGRYARIAVKVLASEKDAVFGGYSISFPKDSFTGYLPAIYQNNIQLERFLAVHQNIYLEIEDFIDQLAKEMDCDQCSRKQAVSLAQWMGWGKLAEQVEEKTLRKLLQTGIHLASQKGTCSYYVTLAEILTAKKTIMIEEKGKCSATVLVLGQPEKEREGHLEWLKKNVPIGVHIDFIILHNTDRLDEQCFLNITSYLAGYESHVGAEGCRLDYLQLQ